MLTSVLPDQELVKKYLNGDNTSFEILLTRHKSRVFAFIMSKIKNRDILLAHGDFINGGGSGTAISRGVNNMRNVMAFRKGLVDEKEYFWKQMKNYSTNQ